jgi:hypothetical protein
VHQRITIMVAAIIHSTDGIHATDVIHATAAYSTVVNSAVIQSTAGVDLRGVANEQLNQGHNVVFLPQKRDHLVDRSTGRSIHWSSGRFGLTAQATPLLAHGFVPSVVC